VWNFGFARLAKNVHMERRQNGTKTKGVAFLRVCYHRRLLD
jgi:hypothetical protein